MYAGIFQREEEEGGSGSRRESGRGKRRSSSTEREGGERERERWPVAVGAIRCLEPRVVGNHLLGVKNSKLRVDMGLCLHRLQPTTGLRGTDVPVIPVALSLYIFLAFPPLRINCSAVRVRKRKKKERERRRRGKRKEGNPK